MGLVDFTNPEAREWFKNKVKKLLNQGVDAIKTDFGERIPRDVVWYDGSPKLSMHNWYTQLYNQAVFEAIEETYGKGKACLYARSATVGGQQQPVHWGVIASRPSTAWPRRYVRDCRLPAPVSASGAMTLVVSKVLSGSCGLQALGGFRTAWFPLAYAWFHRVSRAMAVR